MEPKPTALGISLLVPSVQELVKEPLTSVPPRYVRPDRDLLSVCNANSSQQVPIIDMMKLDSGDFMDSELENLHQACKDWGLFHLINHGVSTSLVEKVKQGIQEFFNLPMEEKKKYWQQPGDLEGFGQAFIVSEEQKLDWADRFFMSTLPTHMRKPHLFPKLPLPLRDILEAYSAEQRNLALKILHQIAKALKMDGNDMIELFEEGWQAMRMNYYPPCPQPELVVGINSHSDPTGITILLQLNEMEGLQIKKDKMWVPVKSLPNAFIVNIGDILEIITNGIYRSIDHRAMVNSKKERLSIATIYSPKIDCDIGPLSNLITPETPALFRKISGKDYYNIIYSHKLYEKSNIDAMRVNKEDI